MKRIVLSLFGLLMMGVIVSPSFAGSNPPPRDPNHGYIEVCKAANPALVGNFVFRISDSHPSDTTTVSVPIGYCSAPIAVERETVTVVELGSDNGMLASGRLDSPNASTPLDNAMHNQQYLSATATAVGPDGPVTVHQDSHNPFMFTVPVPSSSDSSNVVTVTVADTYVPGVIEVCKAIVAGTGLDGSYQFTIYGSNLFEKTVTVPVGACSPAVTVPAGNVKVVEVGDNSVQNVVGITAVMPASGHNMIVGPLGGHADLDNATVVASVTAGDATQQTLVTFTNDPVRLKVCKVWDSHSGTDPKPAGGYPFSFSSAGTPILGSLSPVGIQAGVCYQVGTFRPGTIVGITEGVVPGTKVAPNGITVNVPSRITTPANITNRTISVKLGPGETVVTYTDKAADPGVLKVCKAAGSGVTSGTYSFTVGSTTVSVPVGTCVQVKPNAAGTFPFNSTQTIVEAAVAGSAVTAIDVNPVSRLVTKTLLTRTVSVLIGENDVTEVTFTNGTAVVVPVPISGGGGGGSAATVPASETASLTSANTELSPSAVVSPVGVGIVSTAKATVKTNAARIAKLQTQLRSVQATHHKLVAKRAVTKTLAGRRALTKQINTLKLKETQLIRSIRLLR